MLLAGLGVLASGLGLSYELPGFRYARVASGQLAPERFSCVATALAGAEAMPVGAAWIITASHCLRGDETVLLVSCRDERIIRLKVDSQRQHPTHDVVLLQVTADAHCLGERVGIGEFAARPVVQSAARPAVWPTVTTPLRGSGRFASLKVIREESDVVHVEDAEACLVAGDSGAPMMQDGALVGLLISGWSGCPTRQIFVRLDSLSPWIEEVLR